MSCASRHFACACASGKLLDQCANIGDETVSFSLQVSASACTYSQYLWQCFYLKKKVFLYSAYANYVTYIAANRLYKEKLKFT